MGYTHYMGHNLRPSAELAQATREIVDAATDVFIGDGWGEGEPIITEDLILLNGDASCGLDNESFCITNEPDEYGSYAFCKTARKPYDKIVGAILIYAICSGVEGYEDIGSDGTLEEAEWAAALALYEQCFGRLGEEEFQVVLAQIGRPRVYDDEAQKYVDWDGEMTRDNYEEIVEMFARG